LSERQQSLIKKCFDITWSFFFKKSWIISTSIFIKTLIYHSNFTQTFIFAQNKWFSARLSFSHHVSLHEIVHQKVKKLSFFSKVWWNDDLNLMKWRFRQFWWNDVFFRRIWWVAFVKFNESFSSNLMSRFILIRCFVKLNISFNIRHLIIKNEHALFAKSRTKRSKKTDDEIIKHDHENELFKQSLQKTNLNRIFQITFHISRQIAKHVINILSQQTVSAFATASKLLSKKAH
jgi:hypothetical protein